MPMRSLFLGAALTLLCLSIALAADPTATPAINQDMLFDDFNYTAADDPALSDNGWIVRTVDGWPGVPGAIWRAENVSFVDDPDDHGGNGSESNRLMQMTSSAD